MTNFGDVGQFHHKFGLPSVHHDGGPKPIDLQDDDRQELLDLKRRHLIEELDEFLEGHDEDDYEKMADSLIDLVYVAMGTAHALGLPWEALWQEVHNANMRKVRAHADNLGKRNSTYDVVKPPGWYPPDLEAVLVRYGWHGKNAADAHR